MPRLPVLIAGFVLTLTAAVQAAVPAATERAPTDAQILHLLNRVGYGPRPGDIDAVRALGIDAYIDQQLQPAQIPSNPELAARLAQLPTLTASMPELAAAYWGDDAKLKDLPEDQRKEAQRRRNIALQELTEAKLLRAIMDPAQLQEVMTDFWFNHFNVSADKGPVKLFVSAYERDAIRPYALGRFRDLLAATARHPAMLIYLDNAQNTDPASIAGQRRHLGINENYAREVMELHTLGVNAGYTQSDVTTLAHILTGWGVGEGKTLADKAVFYFEPRRHDFGPKDFLGEPVAGSGVPEVEQVLDRLATAPQTAHHIAYQLAQYFVADDPPAALVDTLAATFQSSGGDSTAVLRSLFASPEFWDPQYRQNKFKPPFRYVMSALRAENVAPPGQGRLLENAVAQMGEPLYRCQPPNGYAADNAAWLNSDALLKRVDFAKGLTQLLPGDTAPTVRAALGDGWSANTLATVNNAEPKQRALLLLGSPEFVYY